MNAQRASRTSITINGFTIVELLIVIVVIAILAAITIVAYTGIQDRAEASAAQSAVSQAAKQIEATKAGSSTGVYPADLSSINLPTGDATYQYTRSADQLSYCVTALYKTTIPYFVDTGASPEYGPCDGHNGGPNYCPTDTYVPIDGFFCDGAVGGVSDVHIALTKLLATDSAVPTGAPGAYVGRQTGRDAYMGDAFSVTSGEVYCVEGWAASNSSILGHTLGVQFTGSGLANQWHNSGYVNANGQWQKISGCKTVPAGYTTARLWTQNNGSGTEAAVPWYQTAVRFWKQ